MDDPPPGDPQAPEAGSAPQLTDAHYDWLHQICGTDFRAADQRSDQAAATGDGGMTGVTPDGAGYSAAGVASNMSDMPAQPEQASSSSSDVPPAARVGGGIPAALAVAAVGLPLMPNGPTGAPMPPDPSIVDATPWSPITGPAAAGGDAAATGAATAAETTAVADAAVVSTADAALATATAVEEAALAADVATAPIPGVDVVTVPVATVVAVGAGLVIGGILAYKALAGDDPPPAQAPPADRAPAPMQSPAPAPPVTAPSPPVPAPAADPSTPDPAQAPGPTDQSGPLQAGTWKGDPGTWDDDDPNPREKQQRISDGNKAELENSPELRAMLPDETHRRSFMQWLRNHEADENGREDPESHSHIRPGSPEMREAVNNWWDQERAGQPKPWLPTQQ